LLKRPIKETIFCKRDLYTSEGRQDVLYGRERGKECVCEREREHVIARACARENERKRARERGRDRKREK